jgi:hypothetical protein
MLKVDLSNAFNSVTRSSVLQGALHYCPAAYNFLLTAYRTKAPLFSGGRVLWSEEGTHQGCPLGPLGFALGIQPVLEMVQERHQLHWQSWYLDDGILFGSPDAIAASLHTLKDELEPRGLQINLSKCQLWGPGVGRWTGPDLEVVPWSAKEGVTILGVPINYPGSQAYADKYWVQVVEKLRRAVQRVTDLVDPQCAHHLLRKCLDGCKVTHLLRSTDTYKGQALLEDCEEVIFEGFGDLLGCSLSPTQRVQAGLPLKVGGCGIRCPMTIRPAARIAALASYYSEGAEAVGAPAIARQPRAEWLQAPLEELQVVVGANFDPVTAWRGRLDQITGATADHKRQKWWSEAIGRKRMERLLDFSSPRDQARLLEQANGVAPAS